MKASLWWVYVIISANGPTYVGSTTDPCRRLRQHNGEIRGGAKCTRMSRPWTLGRVYGPYCSRSEALKAEHSLKRKKRSMGRLKWTASDCQYFKDSPEAAAYTEKK